MAPMHKLPSTAVRAKGVGKFGDGQGLWLVKSSKDTGKWVLRHVTGGRRREMGLGSIQDVSLAQARDLAAQWRSVAALGKDPIKERESAEKQQRKADTTLATMVFKHAAAMGIEVDLKAVAKAKALLDRSRHKTEDIPALNWRDVPAYYASLEKPSITHLALWLLILTGLRSAPIRFLRLEQIEGDIWTIPGERVKGLHVEGPPDPRNRIHSLQLPLRPLPRNGRSDRSAGGGKIACRNTYLVPRLDPSAAVGCGAMRFGNVDCSEGYRVTF